MIFLIIEAIVLITVVLLWLMTAYIGTSDGSVVSISVLVADMFG